jgi:hypothetical protein
MARKAIDSQGFRDPREPDCQTRHGALGEAASAFSDPATFASMLRAYASNGRHDMASFIACGEKFEGGGKL